MFGLLNYGWLKLASMNFVERDKCDSTFQISLLSRRYIHKYLQILNEKYIPFREVSWLYVHYQQQFGKAVIKNK